MHAAILGTAVARVVVRERRLFSERNHGDPTRRHRVLRHQVALDRSRALLTQPVVVTIGTCRVGVPEDLERVTRVALELGREFVERRRRIAVEPRVVEREVNILRRDFLRLERPGCELLVG